MATGRSTYLDKPAAYLYLHGGEPADQRDTILSTQFEFDESDLWDNENGSNETPESKNPIPTSKRAARKSVMAGAIDRRQNGPSASSLPVNVPDWSKILRGGGAVDYGGDVGDEDLEGRIPPHEYLARTRRASLSVHEGNGRTLKGRDLSRVRNAIWKQTGFED